MSWALVYLILDGDCLERIRGAALLEEECH